MNYLKVVMLTGMMLSGLSAQAETLLATRLYQAPTGTGQTAVGIDFTITPASSGSHVIGCSGCVFGPVVYYTVRVTGAEYLLSQGSNVIQVTANMTWDQAVAQFKQRFGAYGSLVYPMGHLTYWTMTTCVGVNRGGGVGGFIPNPGTSCGSASSPPPPPPPPPVNACRTSASVSIPHGNLAAANVNGHSASQYFTVTCDSADALFRLSINPSPVPLGNGITSTLTVDGVGHGGVIASRAGSQSHVITSVLSATTPIAGPFSGQTVVTLSML